MTLENTLLEKLSEWHPPPGRQDLVVADPATGWSVTLTADQSDGLGCMLWEITMRRVGPAGDLAGWANRVAQRVSGLMETLKVVEVDGEKKEAQLRSEAPLQRAGKRFYYELLLNGNASAVLRRFQGATTAARREQMTFALTHEALAKLVTDITASL